MLYLDALRDPYGFLCTKRSIRLDCLESALFEADSILELMGLPAESGLRIFEIIGLNSEDCLWAILRVLGDGNVAL